MAGLHVHLVDGTYELFRHFYGAPEQKSPSHMEVGAVIGVCHSMLGMLEQGATHIGVATDHVVESFRNDLWPGYKTGEGIEPELWKQFHPLEEALAALGFKVWPMVEFEADDAMAAAAYRAAQDAKVSRVFLCTPDKDLGQCVLGDRVVQYDRRKGELRNADGVREKFGVPPESIPDYLALVGDSADGFPGLPGWGAKSASTVLAKFGHIEDIPALPSDWRVKVRGAVKLAATLREQREQALLFRTLATLRTDVPVFEDLDELRWVGPSSAAAKAAAGLGAPELAERAERIASARQTG